MTEAHHSALSALCDGASGSQSGICRLASQYGRQIARQVGRSSGAVPHLRCWISIRNRSWVCSHWRAAHQTSRGISVFRIPASSAIPGNGPSKRAATLKVATPLPASPDTPEPRAIVREIVAVSAEAVLHRFRLFRDVRGRVQQDEVVTLDAARLQPHVRDRL